MSVDLERELGDRLRRRSAEAPVGDGWEAIHHRIDARRRARQRRRLAGCGAAVVVAVVGSVALLVGREPGARVTSRPPVPAPAAPALSRLVLDLPGWEIERAADEDPGGGPTEAPPLWTFTEPDRGFDGKVVFVTVSDPTMGVGIGDQSPSATAVDVRGHTAYLNTPSALSVQLGWRLVDGTAVYLTSARLTADELVAVARAIDVRPDHTLVPTGQGLPGGLTLWRRTVPGQWDGRIRSGITYRRGDARIELSVQAGGEWTFDTLVSDRLASAAAAGPVVVADVVGVETEYEGTGRSHALIWRAGEGEVAEVRAEGVSADEARVAAQSVRTIDEDSWRSLVAKYPGPSPAPPPPGAAPGPHGEIRTAACELRGAWLSDPAGRAGALTQLQERRGQAVQQRLDRDSDIVAVLDDLVAAMEAGDEEAVRSIPGGGC